jgi:hypothetical protein
MLEFLVITGMGAVSASALEFNIGTSDGDTGH